MRCYDTQHLGGSLKEPLNEADGASRPFNETLLCPVLVFRVRKEQLR